MKTFEERYTAWIDGQLAGDTLASFEQELARRAETGDADAAGTDKAAALQLRALLKEHLHAPVLTNTEFFNHQMRERIDAEANKAARRREATDKSGWKFPVFAWPFARLAGVGAACLFVAGALYYGMVPSHKPDGGNGMANSSSRQKTDALAVTTPPPAPQSPGPAVPRADDNTLARQDAPTPKPFDDEVHVTPPDPGSATSATPLRYDKANVIWLTGLPYLPNVSSMNPSPVPAASASPAAVP